MSYPVNVAIPNEMKINEVDFSLPSEARSWSTRVQPSNINTVANAACTTGTSAAGAAVTNTFPSTTLYFDLPCGNGDSVFLDSRFTTLNFKMNITCSTAGVAGVSTAYLRSGAYSFIDRIYITSQNGQIIEDIPEFGLTYDTLTNLQLNYATRNTNSLQYGYASIGSTSQGVALSAFGAAGTPAVNVNETHSFSFPLLSSLIGCTADKFLNIGKTNKLQLAIVTTSELPISITTSTAFTTAGIFSVALNDFSVGLEYVDIGPSAYSMLRSSMPSGQSFIHGITYKTSAVNLPAQSGTASLLCGIRGSSVKSLFARFFDGGSQNTTNSVNGKYDSKNPSINSINWNIGGLKYPNNAINPLLRPAEAMSGLQRAIGSFNNSQFQSAITPPQYCKLSAGGTAQAVTVGATQDYAYNLGSANNALCCFYYGENLEVCARRGLMSGLNLNSSSVFLEMNLASAPTNAHTVYLTGMLDCIYIHDLNTGDISVRI